MARRKWNEEELQFLRENYGVLSLEEIAKKLNRTVSSIMHKAKRNGIKSVCKSEQRWTDEQVQYLIDNYKLKTNKELAKILHKTKVAVDIKANNLGLKNTKYHYNQDFFSIIDTEEKAYWCGFIMADGCVTIQKDINSCELTINLQKSDYTHLEKFNKSLNGNVPVIFVKQISNFNNQPYETSRIRFYSQQMVHDLQKYGVIPCKSTIKKFPNNIPNHLMKHYIRGYFDGNGSICKSNGRLSCSFVTGSEEFASELKDYLEKMGIPCYPISKKSNSSSYSFLIACKDHNREKFLKYLYSNSSIYLDRKYQKAKNYL